ncbi:hypothetical protein BEWA_021680 [Theileria equi strain WA]|uniref:SUI1 domain-containing protein n=1 Tax=Theileria equi strain WA TaxID=1537102 RepID=L0AUU9_THEEQ|nr:hypothetical protein BEWA_021680 [Theileria equi strain WA]AFZ79320.1 hypothetical protein BEWA_021680 [Theileria equi strain WA]|eukprot:XP_004828986.1 hypothetical protein BEWA_021680 [Theileria equi strain WA]
MVDDIHQEETPKSESANPLTPVIVEYCPHCTLPYDFCDFGDVWDTGACFKECSRRYPEIFPIDSLAIDQLSSLTLSVKPKKKSAKEIPQEVTIQRSSRTKRKVITSITGLHLFGVKLEPLCKQFSKLFATGATIVKGLPGQLDRIDVQVRYIDKRKLNY